MNIDHILIVKCIMTATCIQSHELYRFSLIRLFVVIQGALMADFYNSHIIHLKKVCLLLSHMCLKFWFGNNSLDLDSFKKKRYSSSRISVAATLIRVTIKAGVFFLIFEL